MSKKKPPDNQQPGRHNISYWYWGILLIIIVVTSAVRIRLREVPLERDEGEYAYAGQLILQGVPPYTEVYNMKMPGIYAAYALILSAFGQTQSGIHLGLLFVNAATVLLLFLLAKELFDPLTGVAAAVAFALLSLGQHVHGIFANAEHFVILFALAGILLLLRAVDRKKSFSLLVAAILLGLAFLMKQHGAAFIVFAGLYLFFAQLRRRPLKLKPLLLRAGLFIIGVTLPFGVTCLILWRAGAFEKFWFWTFDYASKYISIPPLFGGMDALKVQTTYIVASAVLLWILAGTGLTALWWNKKARWRSVFVIGFLIFSFLAVCPGFYFRPHYFILFLPAVALLAGVGSASLRNLFAMSRLTLVAKAIPILLAVIVLFHTAYQQRKFFFVMSPTTASRMTYPYHPFPESLEIAHFIKERSTKNDRIAVIGSEPQIYFYSNRRSATGYIYTYPLMEPHSYALRMQEEMIREIESAHPRFLVFVNLPASWLCRPESKKLILKWFQQYRRKYYRIVGVIDIIKPGQAIYRWDENVIGYSPRSNSWILVLERKSRI